MCLSQKFLFKNKDAIGVSGVRNGKEINFYANNEVILCAGSFNSPKILQLSGIGPKDILDEFNIKNMYQFEKVLGKFTGSLQWKNCF